VRRAREGAREGSAEGTSERGEVGERRAASKEARAREHGWRTRGHGRVHDEGRGQEVGDGLTGGLNGTEREAGARAKGTTPIGLAHWAARGREGEKGREGWRRQVGPACQAPRARGRAREAGLTGPTRQKWVFLFPGNF
jgi:hypothetical protein